MTDSLEIVKIAVKALDEKKAVDIKVLDISDISIIADYFIITNADNIRQVNALTDIVEEQLSKNKIPIKQIEGLNSDWVLIDCHDVIINVFLPETREFYGLEHIWQDGKDIDIESLLETSN
ncbi:ribosome-associated protein [Acetitomaculum ruminis DSM 5522]|uniref:Ribosomal silencing factor RsfS n=1 Tax=Acetitomaculum ruminis DSM 5522 TaxID=1120918 RepID=A0A1I0V6C6_9FIRM|nr:ribosome silencing factor [Acetitomaculum ruminis]SFA71891.1 ribosome-associated protein [Acetitomaculum ruminis DSM 5522]